MSPVASSSLPAVAGGMVWFKGLQDATSCHVESVSLHNPFICILSSETSFILVQGMFKMPFSTFPGFPYLHFSPLKSMLYEGRDRV